MAPLDPAAQAEATVLDGCSVWETDGPQTALAVQAVHDRYRDLQEVGEVGAMERHVDVAKDE